ncbi:exopolysaccharide biosynthesis polyprenyl glycosylphosphotransferase [Microlunatus endophyticus]|uniref:Exopolysaccharide biosynthesis polyprenyl glycosylphosphotransferase n=1 Tax=Microlunatus endophyticus TaxID=1716077 RepID=A0A917W271_9ACTN|nr:sugar transferase [Microlunatus endophyticus]GGL59336.1 exopolysaccharide biosynthesis polyprenyl glycosylphosphotransferase [Microlunatus endophyticus]
MSVTDNAVALLGETRLAIAEEHDGVHTVAAETADFMGDALERQARRFANRATDFRTWSQRYLRRVVGVDALAGLAAVMVAALVPRGLRPQELNEWLLLGAIGLVAWPFWVGASKGYRRKHVGVGSTEIAAVVRALAVVIVAAALPTAWFGTEGLLKSVAVAAPAAAFASTGARVAWRQHLRKSQRSGGNLRRVIMVGSPEAVQELCAAVERERTMGMRVAGVCVPAAELDRAREMGLPVAGDLDHVAAIASELDCHAVAVTGADAMRPTFVRSLAWSLESVDVDLLVHPGLVDVARPRMHIQTYSSTAMLHVEQPHFDGFTRRIKRAMDIAITSVGLLVIAPLLAIVALVIKLDDRGPIVFRQTRIGIDGKPFTMLKFRSMCVDAEQKLAALMAENEGAGPLFKIEHDPRITRVGRILRKYSIDELPQLFNVLSGSMSLVGPRPPLQSEVDEYAESVRRRLKVVPGLTGLWQVSGRSLLTWEESVRLDLKYVENWSIGLDLAIIFKTAYAVFAKRGAF